MSIVSSNQVNNGKKRPQFSSDKHVKEGLEKQPSSALVSVNYHPHIILTVPNESSTCIKTHYSHSLFTYISIMIATCTYTHMYPIY